MAQTADHGGGIDAAARQYGGARSDWIDLSTGINPEPYPIAALPADAWTALPDSAALGSLLAAARRFWRVPDAAEVVAAPGASALIARIPALCPAPAYVPGPTYNEHARAFENAGLPVTDATAPVHVHVHPNNPDGKLWPETVGGARLTVVDESFGDIAPETSMIARTAQPGTLVLKSFGKFWGLAGMRLGFAIGHPETLRGPNGRLADMIGPWAVSGPALAIGAAALSDLVWAETTRARLAQDATRLDAMVRARGARLVGGTTLFRLYQVEDAALWQDRLARQRIWSRIFPYSGTWLRLGLPPADGWDRLEQALATMSETAA